MCGKVCERCVEKCVRDVWKRVWEMCEQLPAGACTPRERPRAGVVAERTPRRDWCVPVHFCVTARFPGVFWREEGNFKFILLITVFRQRRRVARRVGRGGAAGGPGRVQARPADQVYGSFGSGVTVSGLR